jgi:hypothetical protein
MNLGGEGLPIRMVHISDVLPVTLAKSTPEIGKGFANLAKVASKPPDDVGARGRRKFSQRFNKSLTNTLIYSTPILLPSGTSPAYLQLRRQLRKS